jgi:hypothetical protein
MLKLRQISKHWEGNLGWNSPGWVSNVVTRTTMNTACLKQNRRKRVQCPFPQQERNGEKFLH